MKHEVSITSRAKRQLAESALWWAEHRNAAQALRWLEGFEAAINSLAVNPERHGVARENDLYQLPHVVRQLLYGVGKRPTHRAVFEVRSNVVYVVAIRHLAQADLTSDELR